MNKLFFLFILNKTFTVNPVIFDQDMSEGSFLKQKIQMDFSIFFFSKLYQLNYFIFSHLISKKIVLNCLNTLTNSFVSLHDGSSLLFNRSIGLVDQSSLGEKYGFWLLGKKVQQFFLFLKWKKQNNLKYLTVHCNGSKRYLRACLGHVTQLMIRWLYKYNGILRRFRGWVLKFARIGARMNRIPLLTNRQRLHTRWLTNRILRARIRVIIFYNLHLNLSFPHNGCKRRSRRGKYSYGYFSKRRRSIL